MAGGNSGKIFLLVAEHISARYHNPICCWVVIIMIIFCFWLSLTVDNGC